MYYLRKHLELKPYLNDTIEADLPNECALASDVKISVVNASAVKRKRNDIANAICELSTSGMRAELQKKKIHFMEKEHKRQEEEDNCHRQKFLFEE